MRQLIYTSLIFLLFTLSAFSQDLQSLNQKVAELYQQGKFEEAIPFAEKVVKIQREQKSDNSRNLVTALENLAQLKLTVYKSAMTELSSPDLKPDKARKVFDKMRENGKDAEEILREAVNLAENNPKIPKEQLIGIKNNLAWILYKFFPNEANLPVGFDKIKKDQFDSLNKTRFYERINEAEKLYTDAMQKGESAFGSESDIFLSTSFNLAEFELSVGNFENAILQYEKCIGIVEKKYGKKSQDLVPPLESYTKALIATNQNNLALDAVSRIVQITGKSMKIPKSLLNVSLRSDKAFVTINAATVQKGEQTNSDRVFMQRQSAIITSGLSGASFGSASLSSSTYANNYYSNTQSVKILRIPVRVLIDENGKPSEIEGLIDNKDLKTLAENTVKEWTFRPIVINGQAKKLIGYVECLLLAEKFAN